jgi:DNA end-binding protein Ku
MARAIGTGVLSFGLVSIPIDIHSAIEDHGIHMHLLHKKCGSRVRNQMFCPVCKVVVERADLLRGYEYSKGNYVRFTEDELETLEAEANNAIELREFISIEKIDPLYFESSYYLAPSKGAETPYRLLAETLEKSSRVALAQTVFHGKESLVAVRSVQRGLVMHFMYFKNEVRDFEQINKAEGVKVAKQEMDLGRGLIDKMSSAEFEPEHYKDEYRERFLAMVDRKAKVREITVARPAPERGGKVVDILAALKESLEAAKPQRAARQARKQQKPKDRARQHAPEGVTISKP